MKTNRINKISKAFTVAEIAVVLVLIGVLSVLLLSSLTKAKPERNKTMFKKAYSVIEKTVSELVNDETLYPYDPEKLGFINDIQVVVPGGDGTQTTSGAEKFYTLFKDKLNIADEDSTTGEFVTSDGIGWRVPREYNFRRTEKMEIIVDVNGFDKGTNQRGSENENDSDEDSQVDQFSILVSFDGKVGVEGRVEKKFLLSHSLNKEN